jgi:hypothetical protein
MLLLADADYFVDFYTVSRCALVGDVICRDCGGLPTVRSCPLVLWRQFALWLRGCALRRIEHCR